MGDNTLQFVFDFFEDQTNYGKLLSTAKRYSSTQADAEDAVHDVFVYLARQAQAGEPLNIPVTTPEALRYVRRAIIRRVFLVMRAEKKFMTVALIEKETPLVPYFVPEEVAITLHQVDMLIKRNETVFETEHQKQLWQLILDCTPVEEIASELGITKQNVYSQKSKLMIRVRSLIKRSADS